MGRWVVRAPNHLGELVLALPALERLAGDALAATGDRLVVHLVSPLAPVLAMSGFPAQVLPLADRHALLREAAPLRRLGCSRGILLTPALSAALILVLAGVRSRRGTASRGRSWLLTDVVDRGPLLRGHRVHEYLALVGAEEADGDPPTPRLRDAGEADAAWRALCHGLGLDESGTGTVGLFPGGNAESRRWPADRYAELAGRLVARGWRVLVFGGPGETGITARVAVGAAGEERACIDLGGRTSLVELAGALRTCDLLVTNDTGPMHLAASLGTPILALEGAADVRQTRPLAARVRLVGRFDLPCVPCVRNRCPRAGRGFELEEAHLECMRLITVDQVLAAADELLRQERLT